jgi:hypothetical protein
LEYLRRPRARSGGASSNLLAFRRNLRNTEHMSFLAVIIA